MTVSYHSHNGEVLFTTAPIRPRGEATKPPPTAPTPKPPGGWECYKQTSSTISGMDDQDGMRRVTLVECQRTCVATPGCRFIVYHDTSQHCHTLSGKPVSLAIYRASLQSDSTYHTCIRTTTVAKNRKCNSDNDCPKLQFCNANHACISLSHSYCDYNPCGLGDGDCDHDFQCKGDLVCGNDNCYRFHPHIGSRRQDDGNIPDCCERSDVVVVHGRRLRQVKAGASHNTLNGK